MKQVVRSFLLMAVAGMLAASPVLAKTPMKHKPVTCKQIQEAIKSGKSAEDVAKELKVSAARVKHCTQPAKPAAKKH